MTAIEFDKSASGKKHISLAAWLLLGGLLFLRMILLAGGAALGIAPHWLDPVYQVATYLLTALLIWVERDRLADFHIDKLVVGLIVVCKPLETILLALHGGGLPLAFPHLAGLLVWVIAIALAIAMGRH